jgi:hypothetical protein
MGLIVLLVLAGFVLFLLLAGAGLLYWVLRRSRQSSSTPGPQLEAPRFEQSFGPPGGSLPPHTVPASMPDAAPPPPTPAHDPGPWGVPTPPESFETRGTEDRVARDTQQNERAATVAMYSNAGPGTNPIRDPALFETTPSADATVPYGTGADPFATTPSTPPSVAPELPPAPKASLREASGIVIQLEASGFRLGRHPECQFIIPTPGASRYHAEIKFDDGAWVISDLNSGNGTFVNGVRIRSHHLAPGDEVRVDQTLLTFQPGE